MDKHLILASSSPRRIQMFRERGMEPELLVPRIEEQVPPGLPVEQTVMYLALQKALAAEREVLEKPEAFLGKGRKTVVIGADTVVYKNGIIGKPVDKEDAVRILELLENDCHYVLTGVALVGPGTPERRIFYERTEVWFSRYGREEIEAYLKTGEAWDKAGAYAIQGGWGKYIHHIVGDRDNVIGFPWKRFREVLAAADWK